jgi:TRADD-N domain-containing protein
MANPEEEFEELDDFFSLADQLARPIGQIQKEQVRQARITFNAALAVGITGTLILLAGVASLLYHGSEASDTAEGLLLQRES